MFVNLKGSGCVETEDRDQVQTDQSLNVYLDSVLAEDSCLLKNLLHTTPFIRPNPKRLESGEWLVD